MKIRFVNRITAFLIVFVISLALLKLVDLGVRPFLAPSTLFPPDTAVVYKTLDLDAVASINRFGFRGNETKLEEGQIIVIGDSFTFGFGSRDADVWPRLLEAKLASSEFNKKVYNLGVPGTDTLFHIEVARIYVERLKPSVVILSILMSDDFQQVHESIIHDEQLRRTGIKVKAREWFPGIYGIYISMRNLAARRKQETNSGPVDVTKTWASDAQRAISENALQIPKDVELRAANGDINPGLFYLAAKYPTRSWSFWEKVDSNGSKEAAVFLDISKQLKDLSKEIKRYGGRLVIFAMPCGSFVKSKVSGNYVKYGFDIPSSNFSSNRPEIALKRMSEDVQSEFVPTLQTFRSRGGDYFFEFDGHLNLSGNRLISEILATYLISSI